MEMARRTFSTGAPECVACETYKDCKNKRMAMCAYYETSLSEATSQSFAMPAAAEIMVKHDYRDIKVGENTTVTIDLEAVKKNLADELYKGIGHSFLRGGA